MSTVEQNKSIMLDQIDTVKSLVYNLGAIQDRKRMDDIKTLKKHIRQLSKYVRDVEEDTKRIVENQYL